MDYQHTNLNGFHIATAEMPHMESVSVAFYIPVGSRYETPEQNGIAHFLEHMIFKGTDKRSALDIALQIEGAGGTMNAFTTEDQTCLETRGPAELLPTLIEIMSDMMWHSSYEPDEIEREREVIAEEIVMYQENPGDHLHDILSEALWPNHALGRPITGTEASIMGMHADDFRNFTQEHYHTEGLTLAVSGKVSHKEVVALAEKYLPKKSQKKKPYTAIERNLTDSNKPVIVHDQRDIEQTHLAIAFHTEGRHSDTRHILRVLSLMMGETMSSKLFQELREQRGLCYHIATDYSLYDDTGTFEIHAGLDANRLEESIEVIAEIIQQICTEGFTSTELEQAINFANCQSRIALETPQAHMSWMGDSLLCFDKIIAPQESRDTLASTTLEELQELAQITFKKENLAIATVGPQKENEIRVLMKKLDLPS